MALIPPDAGIRMRMQTEANLLQPTAPVADIPSDLPELRTGQTFTARIQEVLPENTYKALVAGKQLTLQLPEGAKAGDTLELVVIDRTPRVVIARLADTSQLAQAAEPYPYAKLSNAGQMIGQMLLPEGETPQPAALNRGQPLLAQPPANAADLAPVLQKAVAQSGLFYEAHQAQWVAGRFPTERLLQEPQGQRSAPAAFEQQGLPPPVLDRTGQPVAAFVRPGPGLPAAVAFALPTPPAPAADQPDLPAALEQRVAPPAEPNAAPDRTAANPNNAPTLPAAPATLMQKLFGDTGQTEAVAPQAATNAGTAVATLPSVPEELRPLVQQQLDAAATQRLVWHGEVWPNQTMDWEVVRGDERGPQAGADDDPAWRTRLALDMPGLGRVDAALRLTGTGLQLTLAATTDAAAADLREAAPLLAASLDAAGITLLSFLVKHEPA